MTVVLVGVTAGYPSSAFLSKHCWASQQWHPAESIDVGIDWENAAFPLVLTGTGQAVRHFRISAYQDKGDEFLRDGLLVGNSAALSDNLCSVASLPAVVIDGDVTTDIFFNAESRTRTLLYEYRVGFGPRRSESIQAPEPSCGFMTLVGLLGLTQLRRSRQS